MAKATPSECPFRVRQVGLDYDASTAAYNKSVEGDPKKSALKSPAHAGAIAGFDDQKAADDDCNRRNAKATEMGLKARYEVVS